MNFKKHPKIMFVACLLAVISAFTVSCVDSNDTDPAVSLTDTAAETVETTDGNGDVGRETAEGETAADVTENTGTAETETHLAGGEETSDAEAVLQPPYDGEYIFEILPELILDTTVYNADSEPMFGWTVVAAEPGKGLRCTISGWLYRLEGDEEVLVGGVSQDIGIMEAPPSAEGYATFRTSSWCIHNFLELEQLSPYSLEPGLYRLVYTDFYERKASALFVVTETLTCPHFE